MKQTLPSIPSRIITGMRTYGWLLMVLAGVSKLQAQNEPLFAHTFYHMNVFNPAVAGNAREVQIGALVRQQWVGFKEAPSSQMIDAYGYIAKAKSGIGLVVMNDMLGKERAISVRGSYAYCQKLNDKARLSLGVSVGFNNRYVKDEDLVYQQPNDPYGINNNVNRFRHYLGAGIEFTGYNFTAGFAVTNIDRGMKKATVFNVPRHYFAHAKYSWDISKKVNLTPAVFVRSTDYIAQAEINVSATFSKRVTVALLYRTVNAAGAMLGVHLSKNILLSYSYDFDFGKLARLQTGSHEGNLIFHFGGVKEKEVNYKSPRYAN